MANCLMICSFFFLWTSGAICLAGYTTDEWLTIRNGHVGLVRFCFDGECEWPWDQDLMVFEKSMPAWFLAVQVLMSAAMVFLLGAALASPLYLCGCCDAGHSCNRFIAINLILSSVLMTVSLAVFGAQVRYDRTDFPATITALGWSFYLALAGTVLLAASSGLFWVSYWRRAAMLV